jgi:hypothetical protein
MSFRIPEDFNYNQGQCGDTKSNIFTIRVLSVLDNRYVSVTVI